MDRDQIKWDLDDLKQMHGKDVDIEMAYEHVKSTYEIDDPQALRDLITEHLGPDDDDAPVPGPADNVLRIEALKAAHGLSKSSRNFDGIRDKLLESGKIKGMTEYLSEPLATRFAEIIHWAIEHADEHKSKTVEILGRALIERYKPRVIADDTGEFILHARTHYVIGRNPKVNERILRAAMRDYEPDMTPAMASDAIYDLEHDSKLFIERDALNRDAGRALADGFLNYATGQLEPHNPDRLNTIYLDYKVEIPDKQDQEYTIADIDKLLGDDLIHTTLKESHTISGEFDYKRYYSVLEAEAEAVYGNDTKLQIAFVHYGPTNTGKSTRLKFLRDILGSQNCSNVTIQDLATDKFKRVKLFGKLANIRADVDDEALKKGAGFLKEAISGDPIDGEHKGVDSIEFENKATLVFACNKFPATYSQDDAMFNKFKLIHWKRTFADADMDRNLNDKLLADKAAIARYLGLLYRIYEKARARGNIRYKDDPGRNREIWNQGADPVPYFVQEACVFADSVAVLGPSLVAYYNVWAVRNGHEPMKARTFNGTIKEITGILPINGSVMVTDADGAAVQKKGLVWHGMDVKPEYKYDTLDAYNEAHHSPDTKA